MRHFDLNSNKNGIKEFRSEVKVIEVVVYYHKVVRKQKQIKTFHSSFLYLFDVVPIYFSKLTIPQYHSFLYLCLLSLHYLGNYFHHPLIQFLGHLVSFLVLQLSFYSSIYSTCSCYADATSPFSSIVSSQNKLDILSFESYIRLNKFYLLVNFEQVPLNQLYLLLIKLQMQLESLHIYLDKCCSI